MCFFFVVHFDTDVKLSFCKAVRCLSGNQVTDIVKITTEDNHKIL